MKQDIQHHRKYVRYCFELALKAGKHTKSNPMVGAILVFNDRIIGEGYHQFYGGDHAELNAINSVKKEDSHLISSSTLYVSLEPCCIESKTPACSDLILKHKIPSVVISTLDPNPKVYSNSVSILKSAGINVITGVLEKEGKQLIRKFKANLDGRPYVTIKFAQSDDRYISKTGSQTNISNKFTNILVHKWRAEHDGILIGTNTALIDNPMLTNRKYYGESPIRIVLDRTLKIPSTFHLWNDNLPCLFVTEAQKEVNSPKELIKMNFDNTLWDKILQRLFEREIYSVLVEGGAYTINSLIRSNLWDEARIIDSKLKLHSGVRAPIIKGELINKYSLESDEINIVYNSESTSKV